MLLNNNLSEMSLSRLDAIDRCIAYGEKFAEHFNLVCKEGKTSPDFIHHCGELQGWFKSVRKIKTKYNGKPLSDENLYDWFFTAGANITDVVDNKYIDIYNKLIEMLLSKNNISISDILSDII